MLNENIKKLSEKGNWDATDMGQAVGIIMGRALKNHGKGNMASMNSNKILAARSYEKLSEEFCKNFTAYYSTYLDQEKDADVNILCSKIVFFLEDKIEAGEEMNNEVTQAIIAGYNML